MQTLHPIRHFTDPVQTCPGGQITAGTKASRDAPGRGDKGNLAEGGAFVRPIMRRLPGESPARARFMFGHFVGAGFARFSAP